METGDGFAERLTRPRRWVGIAMFTTASPKTVGSVEIKED